MDAVRDTGRRVFWALTWGVGVAVGVMAGGWLTIVGGSAAPGGETPDLFGDLVVLPAIVGGAVAVLHLLGQLVVVVARRARPADGDGGDDQRQ